MRFEVVTLFPELFAPFFATSIVGRGVRKGLVEHAVHDLRDHTTDRHRTVDDYPYGGGAGMVMKAEPFRRCLEALRAATDEQGRPRVAPHVVLTSPRGQRLDQDSVRALRAHPRLVILCGHYKGVDERVATWCDQEVSIGDYVLSGGELAAMVLVDACVRLIPGVVGDLESVHEDSHYDMLLAPPEYTRPEEIDGKRVPAELLTGHHAKIEKYRHQQALELTRARRPDLYQKYVLARGLPEEPKVPRRKRKKKSIQTVPPDGDASGAAIPAARSGTTDAKEES